jgi:ABC-type spermidine/putrescine transport system permease subunit II
MVENRPWLNILTHATLIFGVAFLCFPVWMALVASTHPGEALSRSPIPMWFGGQGWENYSQLLTEGSPAVGGVSLRTMLFNSFVMALGITFGKIAISLISAFAIVYFRFRFRLVFFWLIFITLMLPVEVRILPTYDVVASLGMLNSYSGLIIPLIASATATFLFRQFFLTIPDELVEAARIDRAGPIRFFWDILASAVENQHRGAFHHPLHLRLEPVSLAVPHHHRSGPLHHRHGHPAHGECGRRPADLAPDHGHRDPCHGAARDRRPCDAAALREGPCGKREVRKWPS